jgi:hypothetical protein
MISLRRISSSFGNEELSQPATINRQTARETERITTALILVDIGCESQTFVTARSSEDRVVPRRLIVRVMISTSIMGVFIR